MHLTAVIALFTDQGLSDLGEPEVTAWIERGWVRPDRGGPDPVFQDIDIARIRLIHDLRTAMRIEDETIPLVLSLLDQIYDLRSGLRAVLRAVDAQPDAVRKRILPRRSTEVYTRGVSPGHGPGNICPLSAAQYRPSTIESPQRQWPCGPFFGARVFKKART